LTEDVLREIEKKCWMGSGVGEDRERGDELVC
jgi:hypothetical protein